MSQNQTLPWLVTYDIADPRRLAQVFKRLKKEGIPVQYSVFAVDASAAIRVPILVALASTANTEYCTGMPSFFSRLKTWARRRGSAMS